jgi:hypothetical protein
LVGVELDGLDAENEVSAIPVPIPTASCFPGAEQARKLESCAAPNWRVEVAGGIDGRRSRQMSEVAFLEISPESCSSLSTVLNPFTRWTARLRKSVPPVLQLPCAIRDFFVFRDVLFARGYIDCPELAEPAISIRLWDGSIHPVKVEADDFNPSTGKRHTFAFSFKLTPRLPSEYIERISIVFDFPTGRFEKSGISKEAIDNDVFLNSEAGFWAQVHANPYANVLEIGSRARSGINRRGLFPPTCNYTGFDIVPGENVDCVGDAHRLSRILPANHFDIVFSVSVWEHLSMPWLVSLELNKVMKLGGLAMINTHQSWPSHEEPWDYFRFSDFSWDSLFNAKTGFEIVTRGTGIPCVMGASRFFPSVHASRVDWHYGYLATRCIAKKVGETKLEWPVDPEVVSKGSYPH